MSKSACRCKDNVGGLPSRRRERRERFAKDGPSTSPRTFSLTLARHERACGSPEASRMAERVGFEPTCRLPDKTLSRRPRYDHFGTSPVERGAAEQAIITGAFLGRTAGS